jgi:hypothetical protein
MAPPVRRFNPAPGIFVEVNGKTVVITGECEAWGPKASAQNAPWMASSINRKWTRHLPLDYDITTTVNVYYRAPGAPENTGRLQIYYGPMLGPSNAIKGGGIARSRIKLDGDDNGAVGLVLPHEFGHVIGLDDRYDEPLWSKLSSSLGGPRAATPAHKGYENEMMGGLGAVRRKTIDNVLLETGPSEYWTQDDDEVRDWLKAHPKTDIAALSTANKISMLQTLMAGWISDSDVHAMVGIVGEVNSPSEARLIMGAIDPLRMKGVGQRTRFRIALDAMPR